MKYLKRIRVCLVLVLIPIGFMRIYYNRNPIPLILQKLPIPSTILGPPKGYVFAKERYPNEYRKIYETECLDLPPFPLIPHQPLPQFSDTFVLELDNARIYGNLGAIITDEDMVLADSIIDWTVPSIDHHPIFHKNRMRNLEQIDGTVAVLACKSSRCFYHWMVDVLPRLELLKRANITFDKIYINPLDCPFQKETLAHLFKKYGLDESNIIWCSHKKYIQAKKVVVLYIPRRAPSWVLDFIPQNFLREAANEPPKKIYISRRSALSRRIVNEKELVAELEKHGFESYRLEELSVFEQAKLFASAECIVAPHGAGLTNLVYCKDNISLIEIFTPEWISDCFWDITQRKQIEHKCLVGSQEGLSDEEKRKMDIKVNVDEVISNL